MEKTGMLQAVGRQAAPVPGGAPNPGKTGAPARRVLPIGEILVSWSRMTPDQVARVLDAQKSSDMRFGEIAIALGYVKRQDVEKALALQFGYSSGESNPSVSSWLVAAATPTAPFAEALRGLRSQLMLRWFDGTPGQTSLAITSVDRGDGKSYVTANLGIVFSQLGERTLIIDADLRHSKQHQMFGLRNRMGLSGILSGRAGFEEIAEIDQFPKLALLPSGPQPPNPLELLGGDDFGRLLNDLSNQFDVILIDTPSAQQASDAQVIAKRARASLIVGRKDHTKSSEIAQLAAILGGSGVTVLGATLNEY